jgi:hypothetical protein
MRAPRRERHARRRTSGAKRANEGLLTAEERAEYEAFINLDDFLSILQLKARRQLQIVEVERD